MDKISEAGGRGRTIDLMTHDPSLPTVFTRAIAADAGLSRNQVSRRLDNGRWLRLVRGAFCLTSTWEATPAEDRHLLLARAVALTREESPSAAFSHVTAAVLHRLPVPASSLGTVWMSAGTGFGRSTRYGPVLRREVARLEDHELTRIRGFAVTTPDRTVADCLRHLPIDDAVPIADAALHGSPLTLDRLRASWMSRPAGPTLRVHPRRCDSSTGVVSRLSSRGPRSSSTGTGSPHPRHSCGSSTPPASSWHDRISRGSITVSSQRPTARRKYAGEDPLRVLRAEKDRQAALEALGLLVVRWDWRHLYGDPPEVIVRIRRALAAGDPRRFRGAVA